MTLNRVHKINMLGDMMELLEVMERYAETMINAAENLGDCEPVPLIELFGKVVEAQNYVATLSEMLIRVDVRQRHREA